MAAQQLSAVDYAAFIVRLRIFSAIGVHNEQVERARKLAAIDAQFEEDQRQIAEDGKFFSVSNMRDMSSVGLHGLVNFGGGFVNGASGLVNGLTGAVNWGNNTCASVHLCVDIPDIAAIPAIPIWGDYDTYKYSSWVGSGTFQAVAVVGSGGIGAGGLSADAGTAALNASGFNLARTGVSKISSLFSVGKTGTETATTATASLAADFTSGAQRAEAALANADRNATTATQWANGTSRGADAAAAERAAQAAANTVATKVAEMQAGMTEGELGRTTYAAAQVTTAEGSAETWVAAAGKSGYVRPAVRGDALNMRAPASADLTGLEHINDAEMHLYRSAEQQGATINAIGATRPVCPWCQARLPSDVPIVTELK